MACDCVARLNEQLLERNTEVLITLWPVVRPIVATQKVDTKKRGKPVLAVATFCPFCGVRFEPAPDVKAGTPAAADAPARNSETPVPYAGGSDTAAQSDLARGTNPTGTEE